jgi:hypothetical protein
MKLLQVVAGSGVRHRAAPPVFSRRLAGIELPLIVSIQLARFELRPFFRFISNFAAESLPQNSL